MCIPWSTNKKDFLESFIHGLRSNFNRQVPISIEGIQILHPDITLGV